MKKSMWNRGNEIAMTMKAFTDDGKVAQAYVRSKNLKKKLCSCAGCGREIAWDGTTCVEFGVYMCLKCRIKNA